jgi:hypothetical protein
VALQNACIYFITKKDSKSPFTAGFAVGFGVGSGDAGTSNTVVLVDVAAAGV